jgi:hypothetical protein
MRFEVRAAIVLGMLPALETFRRGCGYWRVEFTTMFEDYFAGAGRLPSFACAKPLGALSRLAV